MKRKLLILSGVFIALAISLNFRWVAYLYHLGHHQARVIFQKEKISDRLKRSDLTFEERAKLQTILQIRKFIETQYAIPTSKSYQSYLDLKRKALGFNITLAPELSLRPESFHFFPIGSFDYLGFFDEKLAHEWAKRYQTLGYDVYLAEIGGYSTLGWFEDPLYSTQLASSEYGLARLLGHEIAHEKLYFKNDTTFSELLASYIENKIAADYLISIGRPVPQQRINPIDTILATRDQLEKLYASGKSDIEKRKTKAAYFAALKAELQKKGFEVADLFLNNASLIQYHRYQPHASAFDRVYQNCDNHKKYVCWFEKIAELSSATPAARQAWLKN